MVLVSDFQPVDDGEGDERGDHLGVFHGHDLFLYVLLRDVDVVENPVDFEEAAVEELVDFGEDGLGEVVVELGEELGGCWFVEEFVEVQGIVNEAHAIELVGDFCIYLLRVYFWVFYEFHASIVSFI